MDSIRKLRIKHEDGTYSNSIPIGASSDDIFMTSGGTLTDSMSDVEEAIIALDKTNDIQGESIDELVKSVSSNTIAIQNQKDVNEKQETKMENFEKALAQEKVYVFDNVYAMKNANNLKAGMYCITKGYYTPNDGGKGEYLIRTKTDSDVDDGGSIHELLKDLVAELIIEDSINVHWFGAKGDGVTDDWQAIQNCFLYVKNNLIDTENKFLIYFNPSKIYYINKTLAIFSNTDFNLNGSTLLCNKTHALHNFRSEAWGDGWTVTDESTEYNGEGNIYVHNGTFHHGSVSFIHGHDILFEDIDFIDSKNDHWFEICAEKNFTIKKCNFKGVRSENNGNREMIQIDVCSYYAFPWFTSNSICYDSTVNKNIVIDSCTFDRGIEPTWQYFFRGIGNHVGTGISNKHENIVISNCTFKNATKHAIASYDWTNVEIINNNFINCQGDYPISLYGESHNFLIKNNIFENCDTNTQIINIGTIAEDIYFLKNTFKNTGGHYGINAQFITRPIIKDNLMVGAITTDANWERPGPIASFMKNKDIVYANNQRLSHEDVHAETSFILTEDTDTENLANFVYVDEFYRLYQTVDDTDKTLFNTKYKITDCDHLIFQIGAPGLKTFSTSELQSFYGRPFQINEFLSIPCINPDTKQLRIVIAQIKSDNSFQIISGLNNSETIKNKICYGK